MWGGIVNDASPGGYGLIQILSYGKHGRKRIVNLREVVEALGNLSRSSYDWQYIGIDCLLLLLKDDYTRRKVMEIAIEFLVVLIELKTLGGRSNIGQTIVNALLLDGRKEMNSMFLIERRKREMAMTMEKVEEIRVIPSLVKDQGNQCFWSGNVEKALNKYSEGLELCPLKLNKDRIVILSNRAQCHLLLRSPNDVIGDTTRAFCLTNPPNSHRKSLWRRSQAYDIKGLAHESLMDCLMFLNCCIKKKSSSYLKIPYHASRMISKQMEATSLFNLPSMVESVVESNSGNEGDENVGYLS